MKKSLALIAILIANLEAWYCAFEETFSPLNGIFMVSFVYIITIIGIMIFIEN